MLPVTVFPEHVKYSHIQVEESAKQSQLRRQNCCVVIGAVAAVGALALVVMGILDTGGTQETTAVEAPVVTPNAPETHVFILAGQSNMRGKPKFDGGESYPNGTLQYDQSNNLVPAVPPLDHVKRATGTMSLDLQFTIDYVAAHPGVTVVLVPCAEAGTGFKKGDWGVGNRLYDALVARTNQLFAENPDFLLKGMLWHQGESDSSNGEYAPQLDAMFREIRRNVHAAGLSTPIVLGTIYDELVVSKKATNVKIMDTPNRVAHTSVADSRDLNVSDGTHFIAESLRTLGSRYYSALSAAKANSPTLPAVASESGALAHWVFGTDNPMNLDLVGHVPVTGHTHAKSPGFITSLPEPLKGLDSGFTEANTSTACFVARTNSGSAQSGQIIGGTHTSREDVPGNGVWIQSGTNGNTKVKVQTISLNLDDNPFDSYTGFRFVCLVLDTKEDAYMAYAGSSAGNNITVGSGGLVLSEDNIGIGNLYYDNSDWVRQLDFAEVILFAGVLSEAELDAVQASSKVRITARGLTMA